MSGPAVTGVRSEPPPDLPRPADADGPWIRDTYGYVRLITPLPAVWLLLAIAVVWIGRHQLRDSISDYYGGPLRDVFVGALMASAVGMIAYKGHSNLEDYALNFAGVNALFVALVPNSFQSVLDTTRAAEQQGAPVLVGSQELLVSLRIAGATLVVVGIAFTVLDNRLMHRTTFDWSRQQGAANALIVISWVTEIALLLLVLGMLGGMETIAGTSAFSLIHFTAATLLVLNLSFAAASHAFPSRLRKADVDAPEGPRGVQVSFRVITALMWAGIIGGGLLMWGKVGYAVLITEVGEIVLFLVFWLIATRTEWRRG